MGRLFTGLVYVSAYIFLIFVAVCLACGLYYLAELAEEHTPLTKRLMWAANVAVLAVHGACFVFEPQLPRAALGVGIATHVSYLFLLASFPFLHVCSPQFLLSLGLLVASHYLWAVHFMAHYHSLTHVLCFLLFNLWLLPFGFFISLSINESTLPDRQAQGADEVYSERRRAHEAEVGDHLRLRLREAAARGDDAVARQEGPRGRGLGERESEPRIPPTVYTRRVQRRHDTHLDLSRDAHLEDAAGRRLLRQVVGVGRRRVHAAARRREVGRRAARQLAEREAEVGAAAEELALRRRLSAEGLRPEADGVARRRRRRADAPERRREAPCRFRRRRSS